jgi:hypothetical protein
MNSLPSCLVNVLESALIGGVLTLAAWYLGAGPVAACPAVFAACYVGACLLQRAFPATTWTGKRWS